VDNRKDTELFGVQMAPDVTVDDCTHLQLFGSASMDFVFSSHLLEHVDDYKAALKEWWRVIKPGGHLVLYLPHRDLYPRIGQPGSNPDHKHDFAPADIVEAMKAIGCWDLVRNEDRAANTEYSFFQVYRKRAEKHLYSCREPKPAKRAAVVRYGAFGDLVQASSIFPGLKAQGYHVTLYTTARGWDVVRHDPNIDEVYLQDTDQVPNHLLPDFWKWEAKKYQKFINLSESVEGSWLALPGRTAHGWPVNLRRKYLDVNYAEFLHDLAEVPLPIRQRFYPSQEEQAWARKERARIGGGLVVMYCLSGSSVHKVWPHMDGLLARLLTAYPDVRIILVGDATCELLEAGWENEPRVVRMSGKYSIRQSLAMLDQVDLVFGPETGVMSAAALMPLPKITLLSHSSIENLTKHWVNNVSLTPRNTSCYPCHQMHYGFEHCRRDEATGTAACQADISLEQAWAAFKSFLTKAA
jgi:ADP-heptose:LPS heptosyltransferase